MIGTTVELEAHITSVLNSKKEAEDKPKQKTKEEIINNDKID